MPAVRKAVLLLAALLQCSWQGVAFQGYWFPVASLLAMGVKRESTAAVQPRQVELAGDTYVVWRPEGGDFSVMTDACPHRLAPLSEGRVAENGCVECPYHGWQFAPHGACTKIPQAPEAERLEAKAPGARAFPTVVTGDLLWSFLPTESDERQGGDPWTALPSFSELQRLSDAAESHPDRLSGKFRTTTASYVRELPYSWDFLVENFMDPAHIPFAHHGLQGVRTDGYGGK
eukprot:scaffold320_cov367-Pinguiococcus_pyrenoidosus.AAC.7